MHDRVRDDPLDRVPDAIRLFVSLHFFGSEAMLSGQSRTEPIGEFSERLVILSTCENF